MTHERKTRWIFVGAGLVALACLSVWYALSSGDKRGPTAAPSVEHKTAPTEASVPATVAEPSQPAACAETKPPLPSHPTKWTYDGAIVADRLPVPLVSQVPAGILVDPSAGRVLWSKRSKKPMEIASMTKMMTALVAMRAVERGEVSLEKPVTVSAAASRIGGSQVYLKQGEEFTLGELLKSIMIVSANDSSHLVAETISGSVGGFVSKMNECARELGMTSTRFYNVHGLPLKGGKNVGSAYDMAILARELLRYPIVMKWSSTWMDTFRNGRFQLVNHNKLVKTVEGVDGLKTGYYKKAGHSVTVTAKRNGTRLIAVVIGVKGKSARNRFAGRLIEWGMRQSGDQCGRRIASGRVGYGG